MPRLKNVSLAFVVGRDSHLLQVGNDSGALINVALMVTCPCACIRNSCFSS